jgi:hypothetical protein
VITSNEDSLLTISKEYLKSISRKKLICNFEVYSDVILPLEASMEGIRRFFIQISQVPGGFNRLFTESYDVLKLLRKKRMHNIAHLSRREEKIILTNIRALQKLGIYFFLQLPPIIGILPVRKNFERKDVL